ncbi:di-trans,poly-cis-decaprenylcistransferase [Candidatus Roizmanbacteria bacterium RIFCSPHIGHO2_12_FULL_41_11]|uniref:Isoprenyl transferase n=2 Tax=Candidatus Roizmaniibacteriota TaxID=1752723 RepID=A0A1F7J9M3_9BACT|nr:MAG: di-trans,poly-cis-decaprenylcistransferase [Candidatus Roizmanbacteria bacterium RIFCSPHIGHO2_12_FULL_41_11]OGK52286.1 MAG: di-trans,poly-cis-decaprenylcistransferase [Candidatus Roizmanbacteria bacterium RIFCSPLOWO2_01_FULL_41_22]
MNNQNLPLHVAIIPDGNRRWAVNRGLPTAEGHRRGFNNTVKLIKKARELGIKVLTLWAFSTENWIRKKEEVNHLMDIFVRMIDKFTREAVKNNTRIIHLGRKDRIPKNLKEKIDYAETTTKDFNKNILAIALDYGGRDEIVRGVAKAIKEGKNLPVSEGSFRHYLDSSQLPDVDLIIRTSGERRLSGFLLWEAPYAELTFVDQHFPDFSPGDFASCINDYTTRQRRFGK